FPDKSAIYHGHCIFSHSKTHVHLSTAQRAWNCFRSRGPGIHSSCTYVLDTLPHHGIPAVVTHKPETEIVGRDADAASSGFRVADERAHRRAVLAIDHVNAARRHFRNLLAIGIDIDAAVAGLRPFPHIACNVGYSQFVDAEGTGGASRGVSVQLAGALFLIIPQPADCRITCGIVLDTKRI